MTTKAQKLEAFSQLLDIMDQLRAQCPWDRKQDMQSLRSLTLEEVYELSGAILAGDVQEVRKEIGDVLLHLVFYSKIASEDGHFDIGDAITSLNEKLIFRHPHIYGDALAEDDAEVRRNWEKLKLKEGNTSVLGGVPGGLPSIIKASRIQEKAQGIGFDFPDEAGAWAKVEEELAEFLAETDKGARQQELGDVLFSIINFARIAGLDPDTALETTNQKFISRFQKMEQLVALQGLSLPGLGLQQMDAFWDEAKIIVG